MKRSRISGAVLATVAAFATSPSPAHEASVGSIRADSHAPIQVMGDHMHRKGEWMLSYRYMYMSMAGNRIGTDSVSPETIATTVPNAFFGRPGQPPTLRVVPTEMDMEMHMVGAMYAPSDWLTLMAMGSYRKMRMEHVTFAGGAGTTRLGTFTTRSSGIGDTSLSGLVRLFDDGTHHVHAQAGLSLPTGAIDKTGRVLAPNGNRPALRLPYPMQLGSGTFDFLPGLTYTGRDQKLGWGLQWSGRLRMGDNDEGYSLGDEHRVTGWLSWLLSPGASVSARVAYTDLDRIDGSDPKIVAPVQTANPAYHGYQKVDVGIGFNLAGRQGLLRGHRLAAELLFPVHQDLNGPQLETDWTLALGWQVAF